MLLKAEPSRADSFRVAMESDRECRLCTESISNSRCNPRSSAQRQRKGGNDHFLRALAIELARAEHVRSWTPTPSWRSANFAHTFGFREEQHCKHSPIAVDNTSAPDTFESHTAAAVLQSQHCSMMCTA